eukprot:2805483-Rhodomonas_salina.4
MTPSMMVGCGCGSTESWLAVLVRGVRLDRPMLSGSTTPEKKLTSRLMALTRSMLELSSSVHHSTKPFIRFVIESWTISSVEDPPEVTVTANSTTRLSPSGAVASEMYRLARLPPSATARKVPLQKGDVGRREVCEVARGAALNVHTLIRAAVPDKDGLWRNPECADAFAAQHEYYRHVEPGCILAHVYFVDPRIGKTQSGGLVT